MTRLCVYEDPVVDSLDPITLTRPMTEVLVGTSRILDKLLKLFRPISWGLWVRPHLVPLAKSLYPDIPINDPAWLSAGDTVLVNARWIPPEQLRLEPFYSVGVCDNVPVILRLDRDMLRTVAYDWPLQLDHLNSDIRMQPVSGTVIHFPWELIALNENLIAEEAALWLQKEKNHFRHEGITIHGDPLKVYVARETELEPPIVFDTRHGPVIVDRGAQIHSFSRLEGPCYVGPRCIILSARVRRGTSIGPGCRVGGEVEATVLQGWSNKYHDGFVGHSWIGEWVNLAAGVQISDLRHDYNPVPITHGGQRHNSGMLKLGALIGDHTKIGLGVLVNTGSKFGIFCSILPWAGYAPNFVPSFCRFTRGEIRSCDDLEEHLTVASRVMQRRGQELSHELADLYRHVYLRSAPERLSYTAGTSKWALRATA
jgi:UDP-N-acetylglucosamine diphosphorylase/glucosamine-1-phosphate N-acetyltransferase